MSLASASSPIKFTIGYLLVSEASRGRLEHPDGRKLGPLEPPWFQRNRIKDNYSTYVDELAYYVLYTVLRLQFTRRLDLAMEHGV